MKANRVAQRHSGGFTRNICAAGHSGKSATAPAILAMYAGTRAFVLMRNLKTRDQRVD